MKPCQKKSSRNYSLCISDIMLFENSSRGISPGIPWARHYFRILRFSLGISATTAIKILNEWRKKFSQGWLPKDLHGFFQIFGTLHFFQKLLSKLLNIFLHCFFFHPAGLELMMSRNRQFKSHREDNLIFRELHYNVSIYHPRQFLQSKIFLNQIFYSIFVIWRLLVIF